VVVALDEPGPLEALETLRLKTPAAAVLVLTAADREADGAVALHAGAEDHLVRDAIAPGLLPRAIRYAVERRRMRRELATIDELTRLPNLRGFVAIAEHQLRMADRSGTAAVLLFVRMDDHAQLLATRGSSAADDLVKEAADVLLGAIRDADLPARIAPDTFCVLLSGDATGAEVSVLSRLVEAIAVHDAAKPEPVPLALSVGSAIYDPERPVGLERLLQTAEARMQPRTSEPG
jgi:diguanylate cyclase (GGDEF)-like protein